jgi:hypothetical protein
MRASWLLLVLGIALACSGEPFTGSLDPERDRPAGNAGSAGSGTVPPPIVTAGTSSSDATARGGADAISGQPKPEIGGAGAAGGAPSEDTAGADGEGGESGTSTALECPSRATDTWELGYFPELREATTVESHPFFQVTNRGEAATLNRIVIRYYFTKESTAMETAACYWVTGDRCSLAKLEFGDMLTPTATASRYLQVSFPGASNVMVAAGSLEVRVGFKIGPAPGIQTNDYSFDPDAVAPSSVAPFPYKRWLKTTLYLDGKLVWGTEPCVSSR